MTVLAATDSFHEPGHQQVLFLGGSKDGQTLTVPFQAGAVCVCIEMPAMVVVRQHLEGGDSILLPIHLEQYVQYSIDTDGRKCAVSLDLTLTRYRDEFEVAEEQLSVDAVHQLRAAIRKSVADLGGRILPGAIGHEDICVEILCSGRPQSGQRGRVVRGECWMVGPA